MATEATDTRPEAKAKKRRGTRVAYAEAHKELKTRVGFALTFMRKAAGVDPDAPAVSKAMIESAIEILEGKA